MKRIIAVLLCAMIAIGTVSVTVFADEDAPFTVSRAIGDYMVLQRDAEVKIWGWSDNKGEKISVTFKDNTVEGTVDENGEWLVKLPKMAADKNENTLTVTMGSYSETFEGILVGDVYLVGGQSNAEKTLSACGNIYSASYIQDIIDSTPNMVRYFYQTRGDAMAKPERMNEPQKDVVSASRKWKVENRAQALGFSAIGFFFAHKVAKEADVPVGMIMVASSGSPVSQLMSKEASDKANYKRYENNIPVSGMYNALMHPFINTSVKGMIYYQGESENWDAISNYGIYNTYVNTYVEDLREKMGQNFPFYYVQLSSHKLGEWTGIAEQRAVQFDGLSVIENSGMVVSMDQGFRPEKESDFAHPNNKEPVGERLAALALAREYGIGDESYVTSPIPLYAYKTDEGIVVKFTNVGDGLKVIGQHQELSGFKSIVNGAYRSLKATIISKDEVLVGDKRSAMQATGIGYGLELLAFADYPEGEGDLTYVANLGNSNDLPAPTFKLKKVYASLEDALATPTPTKAPTSAPVQTAVTEGQEHTDDATSKTWIIWTVAGAVAVVAVGVAAVVIIKKKKEK